MSSMIKEKDGVLGLFVEMQGQEKEHNDFFFRTMKAIILGWIFKNEKLC